MQLMKKLAPYAGWLSLFLGFIALFAYVILPYEKMLTMSLGSLTLSAGLFFLIINRDEIKKSLTGRTALYGTNALILIVVFMGILTFINLLSYRHKYRFDLTEGGFYTLSPETLNVISDLPREIQMTAFFRTGSKEKKKFRNLMEGYLQSTDKIKLDFVDPDKNPAVTKQYGIKVHGAVALESGKNETTVMIPNEENLTNGIYRVAQDHKSTLYFLEGHGERDLDRTDGEGYSSVKQALDKNRYKVKKLLLLQTAKIPEDADVLVINGPRKPILKKEQTVIDTYLNKGGSVLILVDPQSKFEMEEFLLKRGIALRDDAIFDPASKLFGSDFWTPVVKEFAEHGITKDFALPVVLHIARSVAGRPVAEVEVVDLLKTGPESWSETDFTQNPIKFDQDSEDAKGPVPVGVVSIKLIEDMTSLAEMTESILERAKKDPLEVLEEMKKAEEDEAKEEAPPEKKYIKGNLVVIGDSDFVTNHYFNSSGNGDFFMNVISWLAQQENLIPIQSKQRKNNPIQLTLTDGSIIFLTSVVALPIMILVPGFWVWWRRRSL